MIILTAAMFIIYGLWTADDKLAYAAEKTWSGKGDATTWSDADNWSPAAAPVENNDVIIDVNGAAVKCTETFKAKFVTIGGRNECTLSSEDFIYGIIVPDYSSDDAILVRSGGTLILKGPGIITVKGKYTDSEVSLFPEPSLIFWVK